MPKLLLIVILKTGRPHHWWNRCEVARHLLLLHITAKLLLRVATELLLHGLHHWHHWLELHPAGLLVLLCRLFWSALALSPWFFSGLLWADDAVTTCCATSHDVGLRRIALVAWARIIARRTRVVIFDVESVGPTIIIVVKEPDRILRRALLVATASILFVATAAVALLLLLLWGGGAHGWKLEELRWLLLLVAQHCYLLLEALHACSHLL